jgi:hypothetical protein
VFLSFTSTGGFVDGQLTSATADSSADSGVRGSVSGFTAQITGSTVTVNIGGVRWSGQMTATGMTLLIPDSTGKLVAHSFNVATSDDYNTAVSKLGAAVTSARAAAAASATAVQRRRNEAQATATDQQQAQLDAAKQQSCAGIGGHVPTAAEDKYFAGNCVSNIKGSASGKPGADCELTQVTFNTDGTISKNSYDVAKIFYPGCFK